MSTYPTKQIKPLKIDLNGFLLITAKEVELKNFISFFLLETTCFKENIVERKNAKKRSKNAQKRLKNHQKQPKNDQKQGKKHPKFTKNTKIKPFLP